MMTITDARRARRALTKGPAGAHVRYLISYEIEGKPQWAWKVFDDLFKGYDSTRPYVKAFDIWAGMLNLRSSVQTEIKSEEWALVWWHDGSRAWLPY